MKACLSYEKSIERSKAIKPGIYYQIYLNLMSGKNFKGFCRYSFDLIATENIFLDFCADSIEFLDINGQELEKSQINSLWRDGALNLPQQHLKVGENTLQVHFNNSYSRDGNGLHSFIDTDKKQYVYIQSEPYWNNRVIPLFDQPDLKGHFKLYVNHPDDWVVITNTEQIAHSASEDFQLIVDNDKFINNIEHVIGKEFYSIEKSKFTIFDKTPYLSSYLFCFAAGPFKQITYTGPLHANVSMSLYCRESLYSYAFKQKDEIFPYCIYGMKFYEQFFQTPYPFAKYDSVFCPEYTIGAMEYPGVITFNDGYIYTNAPTISQVSRRGSTILHELAHMWFGDLVTMKWWNDTWLKESFADFVSYLCQTIIADQLPFNIDNGWSRFFLRKGWGYKEDQYSTTHPIAADVPTTDVANSIFDGITYSKGAAVLKQLYFVIGHSNFSNSVKSYFDKYQWSNATLENFIEELQRSVPIDNKDSIDIFKWKIDHIETAGLNTVNVKWNPEIIGESELTIEQGCVNTKGNILRNHKLKIAFVNAEGDIVDSVGILLGKENIYNVKFINKSYKAIIPNYEDWAFVKVKLDPVSLKFLLDKIHKLDELTKLVVIRSMYDMVRDGEMLSTDFVKSLCDNILVREPENILLVEYILELLHPSVFSYSPSDKREIILDHIFDVFSDLLVKGLSKEAEMVALEALINYSNNNRHVKRLKSILDGKWKGVELSPTKTQKWKIIYKINLSTAFTKEQKKIYTDYMRHNDKSDLQMIYDTKIKAASDDMKILEDLWLEYENIHRKMSYVDLSHSVSSFMDRMKPEAVRKPFYGRFYDLSHKLIKTDQRMNAKYFFIYGFPDTAPVEYNIKLLTDLIDKLEQKDQYFIILLRKKLDELILQERALKLHLTT